VTTVPIELNANKPRTPMRVNGSAPLDFLVDTGSIFDLVDAERAAELGISAAGEYGASGAGEATMTIETAAGVRLRLDDLELPPQEIRVAPINAAIGPWREGASTGSAATTSSVTSPSSSTTSPGHSRSAASHAVPPCRSSSCAGTHSSAPPSSSAAAASSSNSSSTRASGPGSSWHRPSSAARASSQR
jgi:hypothetical protein